MAKTQKQQQKKKKGKKKLIIRLIIIAVVVAIAVLLFFPRGNRAVAMQTANSYDVTAELVEVTMGVEVSGIILPIEEDVHYFVEGSKVAKIYVEEGDYVTEGTLLAELDTSNFELKLMQAEENLATLQLNGSPSAIRQAELMLDAAETALEDARLYANIDGYVSLIDFEEDKFVKGVEKLRVIDTTGYVSTASIDESKVHRIFLGQEVTMEFDVIPGETFVGSVTKIPLEGRVNQNGFSVLDVEITLDDPEGKLTSPFSYTGEILSDAKEELVIIPSDAVYTDENGERYVLMVEADGSTTPSYVRTEFYSGNLLRVFTGVSGNDTLRVNPPAPQIMGPFGPQG